MPDAVGDGRYRVVLAGAGKVAEIRHLPAFAALADRCRVVAVTDADAATAESVAARWDVPACGTDLTAALERERPDLVVVASPPAAHREAVLSALAAGAWVWCEKPPVLSLAEYHELEAAERDGGPYVGYVFQQRFGSAAATLRTQVAEDTLGSPRVGICNTLWHRTEEYYAKPWRGNWASEGGGPTFGLGIHQIDLMLSVLGDWSEVRATMGTLARPIRTEDVSVAAVTMASGALVSVVSSALSPRQESYLRFDFDDATVEVSHLYGYDNSNWVWTPRDGVAPERAASWRPTTDEPSSHDTQLRGFLDAMDAGRRPPASGADGRRSLELITALYQSATTGRPVTRDELGPGNPWFHRLDGGGRYDAGVVAVHEPA